jgi:hypothetical protein
MQPYSSCGAEGSKGTAGLAAADAEGSSSRSVSMAAGGGVGPVDEEVLQLLKLLPAR